jgi:predicted transposase YbfD/YdcC
VKGTEIRHANVESVSAVSGTGRWLGSTMVQEGSNVIPAAREQLAMLDVTGKIMLADAAHTQVETVRQTLYDQGGDYLLTVKENQKGLFAILTTLLAEQGFSPSAHPSHPRPEPGEQPRTA